jgi:hypothetical protein
VYVAFQNATVLVLQAKPNGTLGLVGLWDLPYDGANVELGQFVTSKQDVLFITDLKLFSVGGEKVVEVLGYHKPDNFASALFVQGKYLAVAQGPSGIAFYEYAGPKGGVNYISTFGSTNVSRPNFHVEDIAYDGKSTLFMLDRNYGLVMAQINIQNSKIKAEVLPTMVKKRNCDNLVYADGEIYMTCNSVFRYGVHTDLFESQLPDPLFKVKELFSYGSMLVIMGENDFKVYHNDKLVDDIEMESMDKFLLNKNQYLAVNEFGIRYGNYSIKQPSISCQTIDLANEGIFNVIVSAEADCSPEYFSKRNLNLTLPDNDTCLYSTPVQLVFWGPKDLSMVPFVVIAVLLVLVLIGLGLWVGLVKRREKGLRDALRGFKPAGDKPEPYDVMAEENDVRDPEHGKAE